MSSRLSQVDVLAFVVEKISCLVRHDSVFVVTDHDIQLHGTRIDELCVDAVRPRNAPVIA